MQSNLALLTHHQHTTDRQTDRRTDGLVVAISQLRKHKLMTKKDHSV